MPNWCSNKIIFDTRKEANNDFTQKLIMLKMGIEIQDEEMLDGFFSYLVPKESADIGNNNYYGTKWDVSVPTFSEYIETDGITEEEPGVYSWVFDTAWSPPIPFVEKLAEYNPGLKVSLVYAEGGCDFLGYHVQEGLDIEAEEARFSSLVSIPERSDYNCEEEYEDACDEYYEVQCDAMYEWFDARELDGSNLHSGY